MSQESDLQTLRSHALAAYQAGRPTFIARFKTSVWNPPPVGALDGWMESLDTVESVGWVLDQWTASTDSGGGFNAFPVFRRAVPQDRG
jgi:hypothetical protein